MNLRGIAWDIDGTLVDSEPLHHRVLIEVCLRHGLDLRDDPPARFVGVHMDDVWAALAPDLPEDLSRTMWLSDIQEAYCACADEITPIPQAVEVIRALHSAGIPQVAVSNSGRQVVEANLAALGVRHLLLGAITLDDVTHGKPDPQPYLEGASLLDLPPAEVLAVEDSPIGATSGLAAGMRVAFLGDAPDGTMRIAGLTTIREIFNI